MTDQDTSSERESEVLSSPIASFWAFSNDTSIQPPTRKCSLEMESSPRHHSSNQRQGGSPKSICPDVRGMPNGKPSIRALPQVLDRMKNLFDDSTVNESVNDDEAWERFQKKNESKDGSFTTSPSKLRAKLDCPVTPGVVERRMSQLKSLFHSPKKLPDLESDCTPGEEHSVSSKSYYKVQHSECALSSTIMEPTPSETSAVSANANALKTRRTWTILRRPSSKLKTKWPPIVDSQKNARLIRQRKNKTTIEIQRALSKRASGSIKEQRSFYEKVLQGSIARMGSLQYTSKDTGITSGHDKHDQDISIQDSTRLSDVDSRGTTETSETIESSGLCSEEDDSAEPTMSESGHAFLDIVLPSGQRLPPPKGNQKNRRTNYRIQYQGPTLLRLEDVYGNLMDIPEIDERFASGPNDGGPLSMPRRSPAGYDDGLPTQRHSGSEGSRDFAPKCPRRPRYEDEDESLCSVDEADDQDDGEGSLAQGELVGNSSSRNGNRPDVWITPLRSSDGARRWKVKRVWDIEDVDDEEPEYLVEHSDLMTSVRDLLGVPNDLGGTSQEWQISIDESNPWDNAAKNDSPPAPPRKSIFSVKKVYDIGGELDGSDSSISLDVLEFNNKIQEIAINTNHEASLETVDKQCSVDTPEYVVPFLSENKLKEDPNNGNQQLYSRR